MFRAREISIIKMFLENEYLSMEYIASNLDVSTRTVRRDINSLKNKIEPLDLFITFEKGKGYNLLNNKESNIQRLEDFISESSINKLELRMFLDILNYDLDYYDLQTKYFYSESMIKTKINTLKGYLSKYDIDIKNEPYIGLKVIGKEINIRKFLYDNYFIFKNNMLTYTSFPEFDAAFLDKISGLLKEVLIENNKNFTDADFAHLQVLILISIYRHSYVKEKLEDDGEYDELIKKLVIRINENIGTEMGFYEISYVAENSIFASRENNNISNSVDKVLVKSINEINDIHKDYYIFDEKFKSAIKIHIDLMIKRKLKNTSVENPLLEDIKQSYMVEYNDAYIIADNIKEEFKIEIDDDELGFLAIHLGASKNKSLEGKKAVLICNYGLGTSQVVKMKIEKELNGIEVLGVYPTAYLDVAMTQNPDIVISTVKLEDYKYDVPLIEADQFLINSKSVNVDLMKKTGLEVLFNEKLFFKLDIKSKEEFFDEAFKLVRKNYKVDVDTLNSIMKREKLSSTDIGNLVAIPHTISKGNFKSFVAIFKLKNQILWNNEQVKFIFMIVINENEKSLIDSLRVLYEYILNSDSILEMNKANDFNKFINLILKER